MQSPAHTPLEDVMKIPVSLITLSHSSDCLSHSIGKKFEKLGILLLAEMFCSFLRSLLLTVKQTCLQSKEYAIHPVSLLYYIINYSKVFIFLMIARAGIPNWL